MEKYNEGYIYNDSFSEKEFIDAVLKYILDDNSPSYIFDEMKCSSVTRINVPLIQASGKSEIEYSRMIGFDTIETTTRYKTTTYGNGFQNKKSSTSSRTITNWKNDSGIINGDASSGYYDEKYNIYERYIANHKMDRNNFSLLNNTDLINYPLTDNIIEYLENDILNKVYETNITNSGNQIKNEKYEGKTTITNLALTIIPLYQITITIRDKEIKYVAATNGEIEIIKFGEYPIDDYEEQLNFASKVKDERLTATKNQRKNAKIAFIFSTLAFIILLILGISLKFLALTIISICILIIGYFIGIKFVLDIKKISKPYYKRVYEYNRRNLEIKQKTKQDGYDYLKEKMLTDTR